ncbi:MAG: NAD(P)H-dependent oxidoreductase [Candidatus Omnitrophica bacterium]|nr:NAD(P)H-dependent oxidoreductase [Candidatus Omnitrophota bacterium]MDD5487927.1 NAD(P)H-dependent oxidoreductase [Candidatus Omnitrophota bacterium]
MKNVVILNTLDNNANSMHMTIVDKLNKVLSLEKCDVQHYKIQDLHIMSCVGCFGCWVKTPGMCSIVDDSNDIINAIKKTNYLVLLSTIMFGSYSSDMKKIIDRLAPLAEPFFRQIDGITQHVPRINREVRIIAIGVNDTGQDKYGDVFSLLVEKNAQNFFNSRHICLVYKSSVGCKGLGDKILSFMRG